MKKFAIAILAAVTAFSTPAASAPRVEIASGASNVPSVHNVQYWDGYSHYERYDRRYDRWDRREHRRDRHGWYNGHRGYTEYRPGYRRHSDGYWYPLAALGAAVIIGGVIASQPQRPPVQVQPGINPRHVADCSARYRSYRSYDNTYQPIDGPRQQCYSPWF